MKTIAIINGPNMNLLGVREVEHYGSKTLHDIKEDLILLSEEKKCKLLFCQSNHEGDIVDFIQEHLQSIDGIVINPAGLSKTGYSILDAMEAGNIPYVEVHMSNIFARGEKHASTIFQSDAVGNIIGLRDKVYILGLNAILWYLKNKS